MAEENPFIEHQKVSEFDFSFETLKRINQALLWAAEASMVGDANTWHNSLLLLYRELCPLLDHKKIKSSKIKVMKNNKEYEITWDEAINTLRKKVSDLRKDNKDVHPSGGLTPDFYGACTDLEIVLRKLLMKAGIYLRKSTGGATLFGE